MTIATWQLDGSARLGRVVGGELVTLDLPRATLRETVETQGAGALGVGPPRNVFAVGWNHVEHLREGAHGDHVLGNTLANDVSARDLQRANGGQRFTGEAIDGSCPLGSRLATPDEVPDPRQIDLRATVNGELRQHASTRDMAFPVTRVVAELSRGLTLLPGDPILTDGDEVIVSSPLGTLTNPVRHIDLTSYRTSA
jgi:Fumarylacetoacetate (FAA) hydrolase family